jgi:hypothetical protein
MESKVAQITNEDTFISERYCICSKEVFKDCESDMAVEI